MLGKGIEDPDRVESPVSYRQGLRLLPISTAFSSTKDTHQIKGDVVAHSGLLSEAGEMHFEGYEIHMGRTKCDEGSVFRILERSGQACEVPDGCLDASGRVLGTYIHGLFHNRELRRAILRHIARSKGRLLDFASVDQQRDRGYDKLAELVRQSLKMDFIYAITGLKRRLKR